MPTGGGRIQFVVSGPFLFLLLISAGLMTEGFWLYTHQPPPVPVQGPPYFVNRVASSVRPCLQCLEPSGRLKDRQQWKLGKTISIPTGEQWWFSPVEDAAQPVKIDKVPMLAVHPAIKNEAPWEGFDQRRVFLVVFQELDPRSTIEHPAPTPPPPPPDPTPQPPTDPPTSTTPADPTEPEETQPANPPPKQP